MLVVRPPEGYGGISIPRDRHRAFLDVGDAHLLLLANWRETVPRDGRDPSQNSTASMRLSDLSATPARESRRRSAAILACSSETAPRLAARSHAAHPTDWWRKTSTSVTVNGPPRHE